MPSTILVATIGPFVYTIGDIIDFTNYGSVTINVTSLSGGDTLTVSESGEVTAANWVNAALTTSKQTGAQSATISANGTYIAPGNCKIKLTKTGSASTPVITITGSN